MRGHSTHVFQTRVRNSVKTLKVGWRSGHPPHNVRNGHRLAPVANLFSEIKCLCGAARRMRDPPYGRAEGFKRTQLWRRRRRKRTRLPFLEGAHHKRLLSALPCKPGRSPYDLVSPRAAFTSAVRARTRLAHARMTVRSACAWALRCFTGDNNCGSILASRARVMASNRSSLRRLSPIRRTLRACATIHFMAQFT